MGGYQVRLRPAADRFIVSVRSFVWNWRTNYLCYLGGTLRGRFRMLPPAIWFGVSAVYIVSCVLGIICAYLVFSFRLTTDPQPPAVSTDVIFGGGWTCK